MDRVIGPEYIYGEWEKIERVEFKSFARKIHKELFCPLRQKLINLKHVKTICACDSADSIENLHVLVITNHALPHKNKLPLFVQSTQMSHGSKKNMRKFLSVYVQLSELYSWGYIFRMENDAVALTPAGQQIASADAKMRLRRLCKRAKLTCSDISREDAS